MYGKWTQPGLVETASVTSRARIRERMRVYGRFYRGIVAPWQRVVIGLLAIPVFCPMNTAHAADALADSSDHALADLSLEELMNINVTSVAKRPEKLLDAPAAVQVVTSDEIHLSGVSSIPQALELAGNLDVAQKNSHDWIISARGFSSDVANKLLVLMDGRTLYTPLFSGVFWDRQDYLLDDIDRIEAVAGPGGTLWGANAVNGVINITSKSAKNTQGTYMEAGGGTNPKDFVGARYGGTLAPDVYFRVYGKYGEHDSDVLTNGTRANDAWSMGQGGFRIDAQPGSEDSFTFQGDYYQNREGVITGGNSTTSGGNVLGRWTRTMSEKSDMSLQVYYDRTDLVDPIPGQAFAPAGVLKDSLDTIDVDFQDHFQLGNRNRVIWGLGYRFTHDVVENAPALAFFPPTLDQNLFSVFVQDELSLRDNLVLTLGTKVEHNDYTGFEVEPSARLQWSLTNQQTLWAAVSRAVRAPSRIDHDLSEPAPAYVIVILKGSQNFESETLLAYELGYRAQLTSSVNGSLSLFYNDYDHLRSTSLSPLDIFHLPLPFFFQNNLEGHTDGFELSASVQVRDGWRLRGSYRLLAEDIRVKPGQMDLNNALNETNDPKNQFSVHSSIDFTHDVNFDTGLRWEGTRKINNSGVPATVPSYFEMDARLGWSISGPLEFSIVGENLLHAHHPEYGDPGPTRVEINRTVYGKIVWRM